MTITSSAFSNNGSIPKKYTCDGDNINPSLQISGVPVGAKSLALIMDDPDAPASVFVHWVLWNVNPNTTAIASKSVPAGAIEGMTNFGKPGYGGPCPHVGTHHYVFKLYALDTLLNISSSTLKAGLETAMEGHILGRAELIGLYKR